MNSSSVSKPTIQHQLAGLLADDSFDIGWTEPSNANSPMNSTVSGTQICSSELSRKQQSSIRFRHESPSNTKLPIIEYANDQRPRTTTDPGMQIDGTTQRWKHQLSINLSLDPLSNDKLPSSAYEKHDSPNCSTLSGIQIDFSQHFAKQKGPIELNWPVELKLINSVVSGFQTRSKQLRLRDPQCGGMEINSNLHSEKQESPTLPNCDPSSNSSRFNVDLEKHDSPTDSIDRGMQIGPREEHGKQND
jgi:hypothetical protein